MKEEPSWGKQFKDARKKIEQLGLSKKDKELISKLLEDTKKAREKIPYSYVQKINAFARRYGKDPLWSEMSKPPQVKEQDRKAFLDTMGLMVAHTNKWRRRKTRKLAKRIMDPVKQKSVEHDKKHGALSRWEDFEKVVEKTKQNARKVEDS